MIGDTPMQPNRASLDSPPPLPKEAKRKAPDWWMQPQLAEDADEGQGPLVRLANISNEIQELFQELTMLAPGQAPMWEQMAQAVGAAVIQAVTETAVPQGAAPGMAASQPMPLPPAGPGGMAPPM